MGDETVNSRHINLSIKTWRLLWRTLRRKARESDGGLLLWWGDVLAEGWGRYRVSLENFWVPIVPARGGLKKFSRLTLNYPQLSARVLRPFYALHVQGQEGCDFAADKVGSWRKWGCGLELTRSQVLYDLVAVIKTWIFLGVGWKVIWGFWGRGDMLTSLLKFGKDPR